MILFRNFFLAFGAGLFGGIILLLAGLILTPWGARYLVNRATEGLLGPGRVSWDSFDGNLVQGVMVRHLEIRDPGFFPAGSVVRIQTLSVRLKHFTGINDLVVDVDNARLFPPGRESVVARGHWEDGVVSANIYARSLDLADVRAVLVRYIDLVPFKGSCSDIDLVASGRWDKPAVRGTFRIDRLVLNQFILEQTPVRADLTLARGVLRWDMFGRMYLDGGHWIGAAAPVTIHSGALIFTGRPSRPDIDIVASARVSHTDSAMMVKGSRLNPKVDLTSDPPYPREQLLLMLATGKRWAVMDNTASVPGTPGSPDIPGQQHMKPELTANIVDYLLFGGSRSDLIHALGFSDISLMADDKKQGVTLSKDLTQRLDVGYGVELGTDTRNQKELTQRLESEYHLSNRLTVGLQKELKGAQDATGRPVEPTDAPDDRVYMKYRTSF